MSTPVRCALVVIACALAACGKRDVPVQAPAQPAAPAAPASAPAPAPAPPTPDAAKAEPPKPASTATPVEAVAITAATLGRAVNADKRVTAATDSFAPADTIFLSVETSGAGGANLTARWTYTTGTEATRVNEEAQKVAPGGPAVTEFHIRKPDGWPRGDYQVVVLVNDEPSVTKKFTVK